MTSHELTRQDALRSVAPSRSAEARTSLPTGEAEEPDPNQLVVSVAQRDHEAFERLYDAFGSFVYGVSLRVIRNPALAEEISQETFIQVWKQAGRFDPSKGQARTWIATLAHRRAVDAARHDQRATDREIRATWHSGPDFDAVVEAAERNADGAEVRACMAGLTALQRESIGLAYYGGLTYLEVAQRLGLKHATVKTRMRDGLARLRDCLEPST